MTKLVDLVAHSLPQPLLRPRRWEQTDAHSLLRQGGVSRINGHRQDLSGGETRIRQAPGFPVGDALACAGFGVGIQCGRAHRVNGDCAGESVIAAVIGNTPPATALAAFVQALAVVRHNGY